MSVRQSSYQTTDHTRGQQNEGQLWRELDPWYKLDPSTPQLD